MPPDLWKLYGRMYTGRVFEEAVQAIWQAGEISGEMHPGDGRGKHRGGDCLPTD